MWPDEYMAEIKRHCPLIVRAINEAKEHLFRGWVRLNKDRPETIKRFGVRLKMEQDSLRRDDVTVADKDIKKHYLLEVYYSQAFTKEIIRTFQQLEPDDQDWGQTTNYFLNAMEDMEELERLIGETPRAGTLEDINAALEENMGQIFEQFDARVEQRVAEVVNAVLEKALKSVNTAKDPNLVKQVSDLKAKVAGLKASLTVALKALKDDGDGGGSGGAGRRAGGGQSSDEEGLSQGVSEEDAARQFGRDRNKLAWKNNLKFNKDWNYHQKVNYRHLLKHHNQRSTNASRRTTSRSSWRAWSRMS